MRALQTAAPSGDDGAARRVPALLASLDKQLAALEAAADAMSRAPDRFGLSLGAARARRAEVDDLRQCAADAARASGLGGSGTGGLDEMDYQQRVVHHSEPHACCPILSCSCGASHDLCMWGSKGAGV